MKISPFFGLCPPPPQKVLSSTATGYPFLHLLLTASLDNILLEYDSRTFL